MANVELYEHQLDAIEKLRNGCILCGGVGTGKSRTALAYYYLKVVNGELKINGEGRSVAPRDPRPLFIITTAKKRDSKEWEGELVPFSFGIKAEDVVVDSWNNIKKYEKVYGSFFIFDEQRVVGKGAWVKAFLKIAKKNQWILLTATPGDNWSDYIPVFVANGFYRNRSEFNYQHVIYKPYMNYPVIDRYVGEAVLSRYRDQVLVTMDFVTPAEKIYHTVKVNYDRNLYRISVKERWDVYDDMPIDQAGKLCYILRKVVNSDQSRIDALRHLLEENDKVIIFYNFTYELEIIREVVKETGFDIGEWNGEIHSEVPKSSRWVYLAQYTAASEGWNCIETNVIVFYSQSYSYKAMIQAAGRIDRLNTPFKELHYYLFKSNAPIDVAIARALSNKRDFNARAFASTHI